MVGSATQASTDILGSRPRYVGRRGTSGHAETFELAGRRGAVEGGIAQLLGCQLGAAVNRVDSPARALKGATAHCHGGARSHGHGCSTGSDHRADRLARAMGSGDDAHQSGRNAIGEVEHEHHQRD